MATTFLEPAIEPSQQTAPRRSGPGRTLARLTMAVVMIGILWRVVRYLMQFPIWGDEAYLSLSFLDRGFLEMTHKLEYSQVAPVGFLWVEWLALRFLGPSELSLHLFPLLAGIGGVLLFWRFCRLTLPPLAGSLAVCLLAVSYYPVRHATEIKPYSFDLLMAMALLTVVSGQWSGVRGQRSGVWSLTTVLAVLTLIAPVAIASSYPAVFIAGAVSLVLLPRVWRSKSWPVWAWFLAFNLVMAGTFIAHVKLVGGEQLDAKADTGLHEYWKDWFPPANLLQLPYWLLKAHTGAMMAYPVGSAHGGSTLTLLLCLAGAFALIKGRQGSLATLCLVPFGLSLAAAFLHRYPYGGSARLAQHLAPAICMLMGCGIASVVTWSRRLWRGRVAYDEEQASRLCHGNRSTASLATDHWPLTTDHWILIGLGIIAVCGLAWNIYRPYKMPGDQQIRKLLVDVANKAQPTDTIVVFEHPDALRANMIWYLRLTGLTVVWQGNADWAALAAERHGVWGISVRGENGTKRTAAELLGDHEADWRLAEYEERVFDKDSVDVPRQDCQVFRWEPR